MASRIMHLAITGELIKQREFKDENRLRFGAVLPDNVASYAAKKMSHCRILTQTGKRTYDLTAFRNIAPAGLLQDDLYLGYYLHLIQDLLYRDMVYGVYHWDPRPEGNVEHLHEDYRQLNPYVIDKYQLHNDIFLPQGFDEEPINRIATFAPQTMLEELAEDFLPVEKKEAFFFTEEKVDAYIQKAVVYCNRECTALEQNQTCFNEYEWAW